MDSSYINSEQIEELSLSMHSFISLKILYDEGYQLEKFDYRVGMCTPANQELVGFVLKTVFKNIEVNDIDSLEYTLYRIQINNFQYLKKAEIEEINKKVIEIVNGFSHDYFLSFDEIAQLEVTAYGLEILIQSYWIPYSFTKSIIEVAKFLSSKGKEAA